MKRNKWLLGCLIMFLLLLQLRPIPTRAAPLFQVTTTPNAEALVLVNSASAEYLDFQHFVQPYLDHFGIPYTILDIATTSISINIEDYAVILVGHRQFDIGTVPFLDATEHSLISTAVANGTGLVNFDNDLSGDGITARYDFIDDVFGFDYTIPPSGANVTLATLGHYIIEYHTAGEIISTGTMTLADVTPPGDATILATTEAAPFLATTAYGIGRAVQWGSYDWMSHGVKGPAYGLDDLVWRSIVWAARKPFVLQGMPPFVTFRQDDAVGPFNWVHIANEYGYKPWVGFFLDNLDTAEIADLRDLVISGNATASIHAFSGGYFFYFNHGAGADYDETTIQAHFDQGTAWHITNDIPISKFVLGHYYELGTNVFEELLDWDVEFIGMPMPPGNGYGGDWVQDGPFRLYETGSAGGSQPFYYADYLEIPNHPELDGQIFNCVTEIRDVTGYEWYPSNDVTESIRRGTIWLERPLSAMQLATLFTHEYNVSGITDANWHAILSGINANITEYNPEFVTLDHACQYIRATYTSDIAQADYDPISRELSVTFNGETDMETRFYVFTDNAGAVGQFLVDVPQFSGSTTVNFTIPGALDHVTVTPAPGSVVAGATLQFSAQGYDADNNPIPGLTYEWSVVNGGGTIDADGLFTAGVTPGTFADTVAATVGAVSGYATVEITETYIDHFSFDAVTSPQFENVPFLITVTARDIDEYIAVTYNGSAVLSASAGSVQPATIGPFVNGSWSGYVTMDTIATDITLTATDTPHTGSSNAFNVESMRDCPCTIWDPATVNPTLNTTDVQAVELGVKFRPMVDGYITGIRFYKGPLNTGTHLGHLWTESGTMLAEATFIDETASGWQEVVLNPPVAVSANTLYVASYFAPNGHYAQNANYFITEVSNPPLIAPASSEVGGNGVYLYIGAPGFPNLTYNASNYWVDVVFVSENEGVDHFTFDTITSPKVAGVSFEITITARDANSILVVDYTGSAALSASTGTIDPTTTGAFVNGQWTGSVTLDQAATGVTITADDGTIQGTSNTFDINALSTTYTIWNPSVTVGSDSTDIQAVNLGVKFRADVDGYITGIRFYKHAANTGTHVGSLWTRDGANLGDVTFTDETASGWQEATFATPIHVVADTTYVATYHAPSGHYAVTRNYFTTQGVDNPPLHALQSGIDGPNGVYAYGAGTAFPYESYQDSNYWVDVVFSVNGGPDTTPPEVTVTSPADGATGVTLDADITATFNEAIDPATLTGSTFALRGPGSTLIAATVTYDAGTRTAILNPDGPLAYNTLYTATLVSGASGITDLAGNPLASDFTWTFNTISLTMIDTTVADFSAGTLSCSYVADTAGGELILGPTVGVEFDGTALPGGWSSTPWPSGGTSTVSEGHIHVNGARAATDTYYGPGRVLEFVATFRASLYQHVGFGQNLDGSNQSWAMFSTNTTTTQLHVRTMANGGGDAVQLIAGSWLDSPHTYRIEWHTDSIQYYIDGVLQHTVNVAITADMRPIVSDYYAGDLAVSVDWIRMSPYSASCAFESRIFDAGTLAQWVDLSWSAQEPAGTAVTFETRTGGTWIPDVTWSDWAAVNSPIASPPGQYIQYRATLSTTAPDHTPTVEEVIVAYDNIPTAVTLTSFTATAEDTGIHIEWETAIELENLGFNLYRSEKPDGTYVKLNPTLIPTQNPGMLFGATYVWRDTDVEPGSTYYYKLEDINIHNVSTLHGPVWVTLTAEVNPWHIIYLPIIQK